MSNAPLDVLEADRGWLTSEGVAAATGMSDQATARALYRLRNDGKVETRLRDGRNEWRYVDGAIPDVTVDDEIPAEKTCSSCGETKSLREFGRNKRAKDGHSYYCKACTREKQQRRSAKKKANAPVAAQAPPAAGTNGWRMIFANPTLRQLEYLRDLSGVSTLDEAAAISREIASEVSK